MYENNFTPSTVVLLQELERFNILIKKIRDTLSMLRKVSSTMYTIMRNWKISSHLFELYHTGFIG